MLVADSGSDLIACNSDAECGYTNGLCMDGNCGCTRGYFYAQGACCEWPSWAQSIYSWHCGQLLNFLGQISPGLFCTSDAWTAHAPLIIHLALEGSVSAIQASSLGKGTAVRTGILPISSESDSVQLIAHCISFQFQRLALEEHAWLETFVQMLMRFVMAPTVRA